MSTSGINLDSKRLLQVAVGERILVLDGAMGTLLYERGVFVNVCYDELNLTRPGLVEEIHREYVAAGAEIIETNTFNANAISQAASRALSDAFVAFRNDHEARVAILTGGGEKFFSAGWDLKAAAAGEEAASRIIATREL